MNNFIIQFLLAMTALWLFDIFVKPVAAQYPAINLIVNILLAVGILYIVVSSAIQFRRKLRSFEPEQRRSYLKRNGALLALFIAYVISFIMWSVRF